MEATQDSDRYAVILTHEGRAALDKSETGLPLDLRDALLDTLSPTDEGVRSAWNHYLGSMDSGLRENFLKALDSDDIHVGAAQCEDDPQEICVRASGRDNACLYWHEQNIILLEP